ncbi:hypothetical protein L195_g021584 [Trifolium pratense]|uniref:Uncharacterized protein n=1 Tax=Trifolium pratense TaxID=57577 RepID=A0A2K3N5L4_TRIPR|nr:hypothetical protein L195_g021584 [Trifolium pratense]
MRMTDQRGRTSHDGEPVTRQLLPGLKGGAATEGERTTTNIATS